MEGMFRQLGIWSSTQLYTPHDGDQLMYYKEDKTANSAQGITEAGTISSWIAAATSYSTHGVSYPVYIYYSMFGFQRVGDLTWAAGDMRCRGFLLGGTAGRTTLNREGLQHQDGHSHLYASTIPNCISYDPTFAYQLAILFAMGCAACMRTGRRLLLHHCDERKLFSPRDAGRAEHGILKGMYVSPKRLCRRNGSARTIARLGYNFGKLSRLGKYWKKNSGWQRMYGALPASMKYGGMLGPTPWNMLHPKDNPRVSHVEACLKDREGPVVAATDYMKFC